jgi:hypothetical protein
MRRISFFIIAFLFVSIAYGQINKPKEPNCNRNERLISSKNSQFYYPELMKRFLSSDTSLTLKEKSLLYYGFVFQDEFKNDRNRLYRDSLRIFFAVDSLTNMDAEKIIQFSDSILAVNPFNLRALNYRAYAFDYQKKSERTKGVIFRMNVVLEAILNSGYGLSPDSPFYVIRESDEYAVINAMGFLFAGKHEKIDGKYDYLTISGSDKGVEGLYFLVTTCNDKTEE